MASAQSIKESAPSSENRPWQWEEWANHWLDFPLGRFLDYGCGPGRFLELVRDRCIECHGVEVDPDEVARAAERNPGATVGRIALDGRTHYPDAHFDTIAILEVIEHVPDERATLTEIARLLKPGGRLLLTTPHRGLLTFLDPGNFKFLFPRLHRFIHLRLLRRRAYYRERFERSADLGMTGDISAGPNRRPWHRHYKPSQIVALCPPCLRMADYAVYYPGMRALWVARIALRVLTLGLLRRSPRPLRWLERRLSHVRSNTGDQLVMLFVKQADRGATRAS